MKHKDPDLFPQEKEILFISALHPRMQSFYLLEAHRLLVYIQAFQDNYLESHERDILAKHIAEKLVLMHGDILKKEEELG